MISDELPDERDLFAADALAPPVMRRCHNSSVAEKSFGTQVKKMIRLHFAPHRSGIDVRIARRKQYLRLMHAQRPRRFLTLGPPAKASFGQTLGRQPKSLPIVDQHFYRRRTPAAEHKQATRKRIGIQFCAAQFG